MVSDFSIMFVGYRKAQVGLVSIVRSQLCFFFCFLLFGARGLVFFRFLFNNITLFTEKTYI